ncbi:MAG: hypothetical protein ACI9JM_003423 [Halioglobus sp.]|jgi:hypothetical protein
MPEKTPDNVILAVRHWLETVVVQLNLCPFAKRELSCDTIRFTTTAAGNEEDLLSALGSELRHLQSNPSIETILLIHPQAMQDFFDYNQFLDSVDTLLQEMSLQGIFQVASFHPDYQFGGTAAADAENYSNRSPYPLLHILREESLERAIASHPDVAAIPERNIALLRRIGTQQMQSLLAACTETLN